MNSTVKQYYMFTKNIRGGCALGGCRKEGEEGEEGEIEQIEQIVQQPGEESIENINLDDIREIPDNKKCESSVMTIPGGSVLYHGSPNKETFNPEEIKFGDTSYTSFFSYDKEVAMHYIKNCARPEEKGYLHKFKVTKNIDRILMISEFEPNWSEEKINSKYCNPKYNGVGICIKNNGKITFANSQECSKEFALCNPSAFLEYIGTQRCESSRKISDEYSFLSQ